MSWWRWVKGKVAGPPEPASAEAVEPREEPEQRLLDAWEHIVCGDPLGGLAMLDREIAARPSYEAHYSHGVALLELERYGDAIESFDRALALRPRSVQALSQRGLACAGHGRLDDAIRDYDEAIAIDPALRHAHENKGMALLRQEKWAEAVPCLDIALRLSPQRHWVRYHRGVAHKMLGDLPRAVRDLRDSVTSGNDKRHVAFAERALSELGERAVGVAAPALDADGLWPVLEIAADDSVASLVARVHAEGRYVAQVRHASGRVTYVEIYGKYGLRRQLTEIADVIGPCILPLRLRQFHGLWDDDVAPPVAPPVQPNEERLLEGSRPSPVMDGDTLLGIFTGGTPPHAVDVPTVLFGPQPLFTRAESPADRHHCPACGATIVYFDPVLHADRLTGYACPRCGQSPLMGWIEDRMRPRHWSSAGFLGPSESLREIIARDDATLARLGVRHAQIAAALDHLFTRAFAASTDRIAAGIAGFEAELRAAGDDAIDYLLEVPLGASLDALEARLRSGEALPAERGTAIDEYDAYLQVTSGYQYCPYTNLELPWSDHKPRKTKIRRTAGDIAYRSAPLDCELSCSAQRSYRHANLELLIVRRATREALRCAGLLVHLIRDHHFFVGEGSPFRLAPAHAARVLGLPSAI